MRSFCRLLGRPRAHWYLYETWLRVSASNERQALFDGGAMPAKSILTCLATAILFLSLPARSQEPMQGRGAVQLPDGEGKEIVQTACASCHSLGNITNSGHSAEEWKTTVAMMLNVGANMPSDKVDTVLQYLV